MTAGQQATCDDRPGQPIRKWGDAQAAATAALPWSLPNAVDVMQRCVGACHSGVAAGETASLAEALVLAAARDPRAGGGGLQRQAAPPRPGERHLCPDIGAHPAIEGGERGAGLERGPRVRRAPPGAARLRTVPAIAQI
jgi:hypothetical protein